MIYKLYSKQKRQNKKFVRILNLKMKGMLDPDENDDEPQIEGKGNRRSSNKKKRRILFVSNEGLVDDENIALPAEMGEIGEVDPDDPQTTEEGL